MSGRGHTKPVTPEALDYLIEHGARQDEVLRAMETEVQELGAIASMQISPDQGAFLTLLARLAGGHRLLEIGSFTGYSAVCLARGLEPGGLLICLELDEGWARATRENLARAGVAERVEIRVGPASESLRAMPEEETFDLAFIDADKERYPEYYELVLARLRRGGVLAIDNVLMDHRVLDPQRESDRIVAELNERIAADERVDLAMLPIADGLTLARRR